MAFDTVGNMYVTNRVPDTVTVYATSDQTITFPTLHNTVFNAAPPVPTATASSGLPVAYSSLTPGVCTSTPSGEIRFIRAGTCTIAADQRGDATWNPAPRVARTFQVIPAVQRPVRGCVTPPGYIPRAGTRTLQQAGCTTSAGQVVGVSVQGTTRRGDQVWFRLLCATGRSVVPANNLGGRYRCCKRGTLVIRTYGTPLALRIHWHASATAGFAPYDLASRYST